METKENPTPAELKDICVQVATDAARLVVKQRDFLSKHGSIAQVTETKSSAVDPVTAVDKAAEARITDRLRALRPHDAIMGEEGADISGSTGVQWVIDPIDGTVNFLYGLPVYAVSVGAALGGEFVAGCVVNVASGDVYSASKGSGAFVLRDGAEKPLRASNKEDTETALVATGFSYSAQWRARQAEILGLVLPRVRDIRRLGSAALDLCNVAEGRIDGYYEHGTHPWDYAAATVIAQEAGAVVCHPGIEDHASFGAPVIASAPRVWDDFIDLLESAGATRPISSL